MISLDGVSSSLVARNESWVRREAARLGRGLPANVEKADLIQVGLIAVAQASLGFDWDGDADSDEGKDAFVRYARLRVRGAMLDELRQMDTLSRADRRKIKVVQIARERWCANHGTSPGLAELSTSCSMNVAEVSRLELLAANARTESLTVGSDDETTMHREPATDADEVEARVDTAIVLRRLESFFAMLPERDRQLIDTHLGLGLTPTELSRSWQVSPSRVSQMFSALCDRVARHVASSGAPLERRVPGSTEPVKRMDTVQVLGLPQAQDALEWGQLLEWALTTRLPDEDCQTETRIVVDCDTRWG
jgi:RNA polymerase sigma factor for flagellar operon FliA